MPCKFLISLYLYIILGSTQHGYSRPVRAFPLGNHYLLFLFFFSLFCFVLFCFCFVVVCFFVCLFLFLCFIANKVYKKAIINSVLSYGVGLKGSKSALLSFRWTMHPFFLLSYNLVERNKEEERG